MKRFRPRAKGSASQILKRTKPHHCSGIREEGGIISGSKIHPLGMRVGIIRDWDSKMVRRKRFRRILT